MKVTLILFEKFGAFHISVDTSTVQGVVSTQVDVNVIREDLALLVRTLDALGFEVTIDDRLLPGGGVNGNP